MFIYLCYVGSYSHYCSSPLNDERPDESLRRVWPLALCVLALQLLVLVTHSLVFMLPALKF